MRIFIKENKVTQVWWNMRIRISINDSIEYLKVVDSTANHKRIVRKIYGNWYIAEALIFKKLPGSVPPVYLPNLQINLINYEKDCNVFQVRHNLYAVYNLYRYFCYMQKKCQ